MVKMGVASTISPRKWVRAPPPNVRAAEIEPKMGEEEEKKRNFFAVYLPGKTSSGK